MTKTPRDYYDEGLAWNRSNAGRRSHEPVIDLFQRIRCLEDRLLEMEPKIDLMLKYPALAEAYKEYKIVEKIILSGENK